MSSENLAVLSLLFALLLGSAVCAQEDELPFGGLRALVVEPEHMWGWDTTIFVALEERGFEMTYGKHDILNNPTELSRFDIVAINIKRSFAPSQVEALKKFVSSGGALYGSWGGPMSCPSLKEICHVGQTRSVWIEEMMVLGNTPLSVGIGERRLRFPKDVGHTQAGDRGYEIVCVTPLAGGISVAKDTAGNVLGVLGQYGKGRTAVIGFPVEKEKYFADWQLGSVMLDNLLKWLLEQKLKTGRRSWSNTVTIGLPARTEVLSVTFGGKKVKPHFKTVGSLKKMELDVSGVREGRTARARVRYKPLAKERDVETMIHLPGSPLRQAASSPRELAEYLESIHCTIVQPLLRYPGGGIFYKGMPHDRPDDECVKQYKGNFLSDLIAECKKRNIKFIAGIYFNDYVAEWEPEAARRDRDGKVVKNKWGKTKTCFNHPKGQEYNFETVRHLFANYDIDGIILDDNFELDWKRNECYCSFCKEGFRAYCQKRGIAYADPSGFSGGSMQKHWIDYKKEATAHIAARVVAIAHEHGKVAGGWVGASGPRGALAETFDFFGGMVYTTPPRAIRLPLTLLGERKLVCLLWAPNAPPELMAHEAREAIHAGAAAIGYWTLGGWRKGGGRYRMDEERTEVIRRAFESVEAEWLKYYRSNILTGDMRFAVIGATVGRNEMVLKMRNTGSKVNQRIQGRVDLTVLE